MGAVKFERKNEGTAENVEMIRRAIGEATSADLGAREKAMRFFDGMWEHFDSARRWSRGDRIALMQVIGEELGFGVERRCPKGLENQSPASEHVMFREERPGLPDAKRLEKLVELLGMLPEPHVDRISILARRNGDPDASPQTTFSELVRDALTGVAVKLIDAKGPEYERVKERIDYLRNVALYEITKMG